MVELMPSNPAIIGPRKARSEAQNRRMRPPTRLAIRSMAVGDRSPCLAPTTPGTSASRSMRSGARVMPLPGAL